MTVEPTFNVTINNSDQSYVYNANVITESDTTGKNYIGLTEGTFKQRYTQHKLSFRNRNYSNSTELSKHIWTLKDNNTNFTINWSLQQQKQAVPLVPHRKTLLSSSLEAVFIKQKNRTHF